jgi:LysR family hydrogen peroxide-inducible transcriptional activator
MVASGLGVSVLPLTAALSSPLADDLLLVKPFQDQVPRRRVALAWRRSFPRQAVIDILRQAIRSAELPGVTYLDESIGPA